MMSLDKAKKAVGGPAELARRIGISIQAVSQWKKVPGDRVLAVERVTGVSRSSLRPDLYPPDPPAPVQQVSA
ncbi:transcriptional regulator [Rhizobium brockwellii]|uniref:transcriptional regulator n=1 Tax=Rhizobium brockwellii TaxID=3019932 RepID=UPI003F950E35